MMTTPQAIEQRNIVGPPYLQVLHLQIQPTMEQKDSGKKKNYICDEHIQAFNFNYYSLNNTT